MLIRLHYKISKIMETHQISDKNKGTTENLNCKKNQQHTPALHIHGLYDNNCRILDLVPKALDLVLCLAKPPATLYGSKIPYHYKAL